MEELQRHITRGTTDTAEIHWTTFEQAFKDTFYNVNIKAEAYQKLESLKMKDNLDYFISEFKRLVTASGRPLGSLGAHMEKCIFIGYPQGYKAWKFYCLESKKVVISERADFDE